jgi:energy-coupling factor transport system ATP-binding protein
VSFGVAPGETVLVLGPSGSGKSTLTLCLDGLVPHLVEGDYAGRVAVAGLVVADSPVHLLTQQTGLVFQDPESQFCTLTVEDEIAFGLENLQLPPEEIEDSIDESLHSVGLDGYRRRRLATLSGGEKQRVALAAVLAMGPRVLVLDEPSANLDPQATADLFELIRGLHADRRHSMVIIEHKLDDVIDWIDSVLVLDSEGHLLFRGAPRQAFHDCATLLASAGVWLPQTAELVSALGANGWEVPGKPLGVDETVAALSATPGLVERLDRRARVSSGSTAPGPAAGEAQRGVDQQPLLEVRDLSYKYPGADDECWALSGVSFSVRKGAFFAIAGANGAGKSTLAALLSGVLDAPPGSVFITGKDVSTLRTSALSDLVGHVFQNPEHQFVTETVSGELAFSLSPKAGRKGAHHLTTLQRRDVETWLDRLGLLRLAGANPFSLSQGQKRRLSVASMLIRGQTVLVLDEPTLGQDEEQAARLMAMAEEFRERGGTVLIITHDMRLIAEYADDLLVLSRGQVVHCGTPAAFFSQPRLVRDAGLEVPVIGRVFAELLGRDGSCGLLTVSAAFHAAGSSGIGAG